MSDLQEIKDQIKELRTDMKANTALTQEGFERMNGRVKKLEIKQAYREGAEKAAVGVPVGEADWKKVTFKLLGVVVSLIALATTAATIVAKAVIK